MALEAARQIGVGLGELGWPRARSQMASKHSAQKWPGWALSASSKSRLASGNWPLLNLSNPLKK